jgi:hypothetical protein
VIHVTTQQLSASLDRELSEASEANVQEHLAACAECAGRLARLEDLEERLIRALRSDPDGALFERIIREVERRTRPAVSAATQGLVAAATAPEPAARAAKDEPAIRASAPSPVPRVPSPSSTSDVASAGTAARFPWGVALSVFAVVAGLGALVFGMQFVPRWLGTTTAVNRPHASAAAVPARLPAASGVSKPAADPVEPALEEEMPAEAPAPPVAASATPPPAQQDPAHRQAAHRQPEPAKNVAESPSDPVDAPVRADIDAARVPAAVADAPPSPLVYDALGDSLEQALGSLQGDDFRMARLRLAQARYRAWKLETLSWRAARAGAALRAYMVVAPPGIDRENATRWLQELEESGER